MKLLLLLCLVLINYGQLILVANEQCTCSQILNKTQCQASGCRWNPYSYQCLDNCNDQSDKGACKGVAGCEWLSDFNLCLDMQCIGDSETDCLTRRGCYFDEECKQMECNQKLPPAEWQDANTVIPLTEDDCQEISNCEWDDQCIDQPSCDVVVDSDVCGNIRGCEWNFNTSECIDDCYENYTESECIQSHCFWNGFCAMHSCVDADTKNECDELFLCNWGTSCKPKECMDAESDSECNQIDGCEYMDYVGCIGKEDTDICSNLSEDKCVENNMNAQDCQWDSQSDSCVQYQFLCIQQDRDSCEGVQWDAEYCYWDINANLCQSSPFVRCEDANEIPALCDASWCTYTDGACITKQCADLTEESECTIVLGFHDRNATLCNWNSTCQQVDDVTHLTESTCDVLTYSIYSWNEQDESCEKCSYNTILLGVILIILYI